jgi:hypothetical protein
MRFLIHSMCVLIISGCGGSTTSPGHNDSDTNDSGTSGSNTSNSGPGSSTLVQSNFDFPSDGQTGLIGPFCCTGKTVTITARDGETLGYAYFYDWKGSAYNVGSTSYATDFDVLVAAKETGALDAAAVLKGDLDFDAHQLKAGTSKSVEVRDLVFTVDVTHVDIKDDIQGLQGAPYLDLGTLRVHLSVETVPVGASATR